MSDVLGKLIEGRGERDAIHIAIAPVCAGENLNPGTHVRLNGEEVRLDDGKILFKVVADKPGSSATPARRIVGQDQSSAIGVVDPFLHQNVAKGQQFYVCLYPGSITSLRHEWTHPAFAAKEPSADLMAESERWLREYAARIKPYDVESIGAENAFHSLIDGLRQGEVFAHGTDLHSFAELEEADDLKLHAERYLGIRIEWGRFSFSCSC